nr:hypothetical protein [Ruegeria sp. HKCCD8929]
MAAADLLAVPVKPELTQKTMHANPDRIRFAVMDGENCNSEELEPLPDACEIRLIP